MFAAYQNRSGLYRNVAVETGLTDADPHRLIAMLYDGAIEAVLRARGALKARDIPGRGAAIGKAIGILEQGLRPALNLDTGELAHNLNTLYAYMSQELLKANLHADDAKLAHVQSLLNTLREGWKGITGTAMPG